MITLDYDALMEQSKEQLAQMLVRLSESYSNIESEVYSKLSETKEAIQWHLEREDRLERKIADAKNHPLKGALYIARQEGRIHRNEVETARFEGKREILHQLLSLFMDSDELERDPCEPEHVEYLGPTDDNEVVTHS